MRNGVVDKGTNGVAGEIGLMNMGRRLSTGRKVFQEAVGYRHFARFMGATDDPENALRALASIEVPTPEFLAALNDWADRLAAGMLNAIYLIDPQLILITGPLAMLYRKVDTRVQERIRAFYIPGLPIPRISTVGADQMLPAIGASAYVREELFMLPVLDAAT